MLNEIVFRGFKSFADEQIMKFEKGTNGIIGPNGCGKSNIIDGISFVLGAQSAKNLRGGKMEDVIFGGSSTRKPKNEAEVTLKLNNEKGTFKKAKGLEVSVTRKVIRGGGSEYYIDNEPVRLKDVQNLFMDTGVGSDSYSIIGQGQIGKILSTRLEERRAIFEEAAGIVKLKQQKEQTEKRLKEVDTNMLRMEDIVKEIEKQLKPLEKQSEKALEFKKLDDELRSLEVQYLLHEYDTLNTKIEDASLELEELNKNSTSLSTTLISKEDELNVSKSHYQEKNNDLFDLQNSSAEYKEELEKTKGSISLNNERILNATKQIAEADENLKEIEEKHSLSTEDFRTKKNRLEEISATLKEVNTEIDLVNENIIKMENKKMVSSNELEHSKKKSVEEYNELNKKKYELSEQERRILEMQEELKIINSKLEQISSEKNGLEEQEKQTKNDYLLSLTSLKEKEKLFNSSQNELKEKNLQFSENLKQLQDTEGKWYRVKGQLENIENIIEKNEGFYDGVKSILNEKKQGKFDGVFGAVAEIVNVDKKFEVALENLLQSSMQFLITSNDTVAKECVQFLKKERKGRATFLPLNLANPYTFDSKELKVINGYPGIHLALESISFDEQFLPIMESLLGRSIVADNLDIALSFLKEKKIRAKISTKEGEIVQSGSISGGQSKNQKSSFFTKRRELDELKIQFNELNSSLLTFKEMNENLSIKITEQEQAINTLNDEVDSTRNMTKVKEKESEDAQYALERFTERTEELNVQEKETAMHLNELKKIVIKQKFSIDTIEQSYSSLASDIDNKTKQLAIAEDELASLKELKNNTFLTVTRLNEEEKQIKSYLEEINNGNDSVEDKIKKLYLRKESEEERIVELQDHGISLNTQMEKLTIQMDELTAKIETMHKENLELHNTIEIMEKSLKELRLQKYDIDKALNQKEIYLSKRETEKTNNLNRLSETYEMNEQQLASFERKEIDSNVSKKQISDLKKQISTLGNINHSAIEDYDLLKNRYKEEKGQLNDVKTAKEDLRTLISNVESEMISRFTESFDSIAEKFAQTFVELFEGGKAKVTLENPQEPLTSAIEIIAQPPGKKPASINLLSGGEKSFTAVALIFAIISSKPSPFVILDEVDAPLDVANVARFAKQLRRYRDMTQFVVITHRDGTKMACDQITGITQEEQGVSIVFPYSLDDKQSINS